jgi:hypothetical protein
MALSFDTIAAKAREAVGRLPVNALGERAAGVGRKAAASLPRRPEPTPGAERAVAEGEAPLAPSFVGRVIAAIPTNTLLALSATAIWAVVLFLYYR